MSHADHAEESLRRHGDHGDDASELGFSLLSPFFVSFGYGGFGAGPRPGCLGGDDSCETKPIGAGPS